MPPAPDLHILVVEDDPVVRADLMAALAELGYVVAGGAGSLPQARTALETLSPDLVLLDIHLGEGKEGIELAHHLNQHWLIPFIFLTAYSDDRTLNEVRETLPAGFVLKPFDDARLKAAIEIARHTYYAVLQPHLRSGLSLQLPEPLTPRETELLRLLCQGLTNRELAEATFVSLNTVKTHLKNLYLKLQVRNRAEAILRVQRAG
ncbi:MAG: DNA-binding response regulator [Bacteroidetes bacterium]|nr:MAG: DNA-binding response regulator [Bacteroidota bacterium]